jgi:hypothetical protein
MKSPSVFWMTAAMASMNGINVFSFYLHLEPIHG